MTLHCWRAADPLPLNKMYFRMEESGCPVTYRCKRGNNELESWQRFLASALNSDDMSPQLAKTHMLLRMHRWNVDARKKNLHEPGTTNLKLQNAINSISGANSCAPHLPGLTLQQSPSACTCTVMTADRSECEDIAQQTADAEAASRCTGAQPSTLSARSSAVSCSRLVHVTYRTATASASLCCQHEGYRSVRWIWCVQLRMLCELPGAAASCSSTSLMASSAQTWTSGTHLQVGCK